MTRCCRDNINLKSSAYNQTGQSYVDQLSLHRSMCTHMRRILLAKSVVDSRNPKYMQIMQNRYRPSSYKPRFLEGCPSNETIDKLAYDTEHHPSEIVKEHFHSKISSKELNCRKDRQYLNSDVNCPCVQLNSAKSKFKHHKRLEDFQYSRGQQGIKDITYKSRKFPYSKYEYFSCRSNRPRHDEGAFGCSMNPSDVPQNKTMINQYDEREEKTFGRFAERGEEEARYAKFVYDITQEIVRNGLYTDRELKEVFKKHLERSSGQLNKRKMLYEIYQLKISLNMMDDSEDEDEAEADLVFAEKFSKLRVPKPPTPPKILNENKILEKLQSFNQQQKLQERNLTSSLGRKNVVLIDANPEFLVTERDILSTLMDNHVNPEQIQRIYKHLFQRSKDMSLCEAVQVGKEVTHTHRLKQIERGISAISLNNSVKERLHGILRKEDSNDFINKTLSSQTSYPRHEYINNKGTIILDKKEKWKTDENNCKIQIHINSVEEKMQQDLTKIPVQENDYFNNEINVGDHMNIANEAEKLIEKKSNKMEINKIQSFSEVLQHFSEKKRNSMSKIDSNDINRIIPSEENEEIEEEIESEIEDISDKLGKSSIVKRKESSDNEGNEDKDDYTSIESNISHESFKYSNDFSNSSESSSKNDSSHFRSNEESPLPVPPDKVKNQRYSSIKDYVEKLGIPDNKVTWHTGSSSDSSSISNLSEIKNVAYQNKWEENLSKANEVNRVIKKRTSWGIVGLKPVNTWNQRISELSSDLFVNSTYNYCSNKCRLMVDKKCSDSCKFVKTNCKNFSKPTNCLNKVEESSESSDSSSSL